MSDLQLPNAGEALTKGERPALMAESWYRQFAALFSQFRDTTRGLSDAEGGLATKAAKGQPDGEPISIQFADDGDYDFLWAHDACAAISTDTIARTGTATATFKKNGVAFGGTANAVSTTLNQQVQPAPLALVRGDLVTVTISGSVSCEGLAALIRYTRTLV